MSGKIPEQREGGTGVLLHRFDKLFMREYHRVYIVHGFGVNRVGHPVNEGQKPEHVTGAHDVQCYGFTVRGDAVYFHPAFQERHQHAVCVAFAPERFTAEVSR